MKVENGSSDHLPPLSATSVKPGIQPEEDSGQKIVTESDAFNVQLSTTATLKNEDLARLERLSSIRKQLAEGTYSISGKDVADKMLKVLKN